MDLVIHVHHRARGLGGNCNCPHDPFNGLDQFISLIGILIILALFLMPTVKYVV